MIQPCPKVLAGNVAVISTIAHIRDNRLNSNASRQRRKTQGAMTQDATVGCCEMEHSASAWDEICDRTDGRRKNAESKASEKKDLGRRRQSDGPRSPRLAHSLLPSFSSKVW